LVFHQLELRYERLRVVRPEAERRLLASLAEVGQQVPIVVVKDSAADRYVVIDGYKRIRGLHKLARDVVVASNWEGEEAEALILTRLLQTAESETALEQSWLLLELKQRFGFSVQRGEIVAHGAAKYLVPLARANRQACLELVEAIGATRLTSSDLGILYRAYQSGNWVTRQRLLQAPLVFLKSYRQMQVGPVLVEASPGDNLLSDLEVLSSAARRADRRLRQGALRKLADPERQELARCLDQSLHETQRLAERFHQEMGDVGSEHASCDSEAPATRA